MVLIIGGLFMGFVAVLAHAQLGWFLLVPLVGAVVLVAAGFGNLRNGRPEDALEAMDKLQRDPHKAVAENLEVARQEQEKARGKKHEPGPDTTP